jgi:antitoxin component YwqK of YwqJK toxin-antitoxin module
LTSGVELTHSSKKDLTMKKLLILLFSILISFNSWGETICGETDAQEREGIIYLPNEFQPFTGKHLCKYENGQKKTEGNYKDGKLDGKWTVWYENGQILKEENWKDNIPDGNWTYWFENGQKKSEVNYKDGKLDGVYNSWYENGQKKVEAYFKDGKYTKWTEWRKNGKKKWNCWGLC